jgi:hypothetical protein
VERSIDNDIPEIDPSKGEWGRYRYDEISELEALLFPEERKLMAWLAERIYRGQGEIIDAGAFLGGSAACFAYGLNRNVRVEKKDTRIHSFDLFRKGNWLKDGVKSWDARQNGQSTIDLFHDQVSDLEHMISIYPGDITKRYWHGGEIEILMLDCSKTEALNDHCMRMFMPDMIPGRSFLIHQDYAVQSGLYWLHSTMYLLKDYFEHVATVKFGGTTLFRCKKRITPEVIEQAITNQNQNPKSILNGALAEARRIEDEKLAHAIQFSHELRP